MHAYSFVSPGVVHCAANEVVRFFVCFAAIVPSVGLLFSSSTPDGKFEFLIISLKVQNFESTSSGARVGICMGMREDQVCGRTGVLVSGCIFSIHTRSPFLVSITRGTTRDTLVTACHESLPRVVGKYTSEMEESCDLATEELIAMCAVRGGAPFGVRRETNVAEESEESCL